MKHKAVAGMLLALLSIGIFSVVVVARTRSILGDVNGDGIIDITDVVIVALAFGTEVGDPDWNALADLNNDWVIDIVDIVIIAINFGKTNARVTCSGISHNTTFVGQPCKFQVTVVANEGLSHWRFGCNATGRWVNETWQTFSSNPETINWNETLPASIGQRVEYEFYCNDTSGNWGGTGKRTLRTTFQTYLWVNGFGQTETDWTETGSSPYLDNTTLSRISVSDAVNQYESWFSFEDTVVAPDQVWLEIEAYAPAGDTFDDLEVYTDNGVSNDTWSIALPYKEYAWNRKNLTSHLSTVAEINNARIRMQTETVGPYYVRKARLHLYYAPYFDLSRVEDLSVIKDGNRKAGEDCTLCIKWVDRSGLSTYAFNYAQNDTWLAENITGSLSGTESWVNQSFALSLDSTGRVQYRFWANDTNDYWEDTGEQEFHILWEGHKASQENIAGLAGTQSMMHSLGRHTFYGENSERWWLFMLASDGNTKYTSSQNGTSWETLSYVRGGVGGGGRFYVCYENRGGHDYIHYQYCSEAKDNPLLYRRGECFSNGTIVWSGGEQTVVVADARLQYAPEGICTVSSGCVYIVYEWSTKSWDLGDIHVNITKTENTNGTWATASGYPKNITMQYESKEITESWVTELTGDSVYVVSCITGKPLRGREVANDTVGSVETITSGTNYVAEAREFSIASAYGEVFVVYLTKASLDGGHCRIRYSHRTSGGSWDIKGELVSSYTTNFDTPISSITYPVVGYDMSKNVTYVNWFTESDNSGWLKYRQGGSWQIRKRVANPVDYTILYDPNTLPEHGRSVMFTMRMESDVSGRNAILATLYEILRPLQP